MFTLHNSCTSIDGPDEVCRPIAGLGAEIRDIGPDKPRNATDCGIDPGVEMAAGGIVINVLTKMLTFKQRPV